MTDHDLARRALRLLDLTDLSDTSSTADIDALCAKAVNPHGPVAAVCVWPRMVARALVHLQGSPVRIATVVNFPVGGEDVEAVVAETRQALAGGAHEIDLVLPYRALLRGEPEVAAAMVARIRAEVPAPGLLKVILETGALGSAETVAAASRTAIANGADFVKTSTGKIGVSATPDAAAVMLQAIRAAGRPVGLKPSGGMRTLADAKLYLELAESVMGPGWATPATFRFGASGLFDALVAVIEGGGAGAAKTEGY